MLQIPAATTGMMKIPQQAVGNSRPLITSTQDHDRAHQPKLYESPEVPEEHISSLVGLKNYGPARARKPHCGGDEQRVATATHSA